jgi:uncharacterized membrane protein
MSKFTVRDAILIILENTEDWVSGSYIQSNVQANMSYVSTILQKLAREDIAEFEDRERGNLSYSPNQQKSAGALGTMNSQPFYMRTARYWRIKRDV